MRHKLFKVDKAIDRIVYWYGFYLMLTGAFSWLASKLTVLGQIGWPEAIFIGLFTTVVLVFASSFGLFAWRYFRPLSAEQHHKDVTHPQSDNLVTHSALNETKNQLTKYIEKHADANKASLEKQSEGLSETRERMNNMQNDLATIREYCETTYYQMNIRFNNVDQSFAAILHREKLTRTADLLDQRAEELSIPANEQRPFDNFEVWLDDQNEWRNLLERWMDLAEEYIPQVREHIYYAPEQKYGGEWTAADDLFPHSEAIVRYKTFRIYLENFRHIRGAVEDAVEYAAFVGASQSGALKDY